MRKRLYRTFQALAILMLALTLVQPILGPLAFFRPDLSGDYQLMHEIVGHVLSYLIIVIAILVPFTRHPRRWLLFGCSAAQLVAIWFQLGLGFQSRDDAGVLAFHIPLGVFVLLMSILIVALSFGLSFRLGRTPSTA